MRARVQEFARLLRSNDVRVSTSEVIDACGAADAVGWSDPALVRAALSATLVKRDPDRPIFDDLFSLYFLHGARLWAQGAGLELLSLLTDAGLSDQAAQRLLEALQNEAANLSQAARLAMQIAPWELAARLLDAGLDIDVSNMSSPLQVGFYSYQLGERLGLSAGEQELAGLLRRLVESGRLSAEEGDVAGGVVKQRFSRLRESVREYVETEFRQRHHDFVARTAAASLVDKPIMRLSRREADSLRAEVRRLAALLKSRLALRPAVRRRGRLDVRRTLRRALATEGIPFELVYRKRKRRKPRLIILCDISDSVSNVSRFMLQFVYAVQELFDRVYPFAFVSELGDLSELFRDNDADRAVEKALSGDVVNVFANSNYGRVLSQFVDAHLGKVNRRTTVVIIGDGRNNYHPSKAHLLTVIQRQAKELLWLNPEAQPAWGFGDSAMPEYASRCDRVAVVRSLSSLRQVVDDLARS